jgi:hypothetical protein
MSILVMKAAHLEPDSELYAGRIMLSPSSRRILRQEKQNNKLIVLMSWSCSIPDIVLVRGTYCLEYRGNKAIQPGSLLTAASI